jgi:hypothetical protein
MGILHTKFRPNQIKSVQQTVFTPVAMYSTELYSVRNYSTHVYGDFLHRILSNRAKSIENRTRFRLRPSIN